MRGWSVWIPAVLVIAAAGWAMLQGQGPPAQSPARRGRMGGPEGTTPASRPAVEPGIAVSSIVHSVDYRRTEPEQFLVHLRYTCRDADKIAYIFTRPNIEEARDDGGNSLLLPAATEAAVGVGLLDGSMGVNLQVALRPPPADKPRAKAIALLSGKLRAAEAVKMETVSLDVPGTEERNYGGVKATFTSAMQATACRVQVAFERAPGMTDDRWEEWEIKLRTIRASAVNAAGDKWGSSTFGPGASSTGATKLSKTFSLTGPAGGGGQGAAATRATVEWVQETKAVEIPFRVENVLLP